MYYGRQIPPNPIGNIVNISGNGYNQQQIQQQQQPYGYQQPQMYPNYQPQQYMNGGGYYSNNYGGSYFNPYIEQEKMRMQQAQLRDQQMHQTKLLKEMSKSVNRSLGVEVNEEYLNKMYDPQQQQNMYQQQQYDPDRMTTNNLVNLIQYGYKGNIENDRLLAANNQLYEQARQQCPNDVGYIEFSKQATDMVVSIMKEQTLARERDLSNVYMGNSYKNVVNSSSNNNYFRSMFNNNNFDSLDTLEVTLPDHLTKSIEERKAKFFQSISSR